MFENYALRPSRADLLDADCTRGQGSLISTPDRPGSGESEFIEHVYDTVWDQRLVEMS